MVGNTGKSSREVWQTSSLLNHFSLSSAQTFVESFTSELIKAHEEVASTVATSIPPLPEDLVLTEYAHSRKRVFVSKAMDVSLANLSLPTWIRSCWTKTELS